MNEKNQVCWNITSKCNQNCRYCHRFLEIKELTFKENKKILKKMIEEGITNITWTGGEALLYENLVKLIKISKKAGVHNKLITNGIVFSQLGDKEKEEICENIDTMVLSIDSINEKTNVELGRGKNHFDVIKEVLDYLNDKDIKVNINTVLNKKNLGEIEELGEFLNNYKIGTWKFFKFMPLRETARKNREEFEISDEQFESIMGKYDYLENIKKFNYKQEEQMEKRVLVIENGDIIVTEENQEGTKDVIKGNAMYDNVVEAIKESRQPKTKNVFRDSLKVNQENKEKNNKCESYPECCNETYKKEDGKEPDIDE